MKWRAVAQGLMHFVARIAGAPALPGDSEFSVADAQEGRPVPRADGEKSDEPPGNAR